MEHALNRPPADVYLQPVAQQPEVPSLNQRTDASILSQLQQFEDFRQSRAHLLPSKVAGQWYLKRHKVDLVRAGAVILSGRSWLVHPERFDAAFLAIAQRNTLRQLGIDESSANAPQ